MSVSSPAVAVGATTMTWRFELEAASDARPTGLDVTLLLPTGGWMGWPTPCVVSPGPAAVGRTVECMASDDGRALRLVVLPDADGVALSSGVVAEITSWLSPVAPPGVHATQLLRFESTTAQGVPAELGVSVTSVTVVDPCATDRDRDGIPDCLDPCPDVNPHDMPADIDCNADCRWGDVGPACSGDGRVDTLDFVVARRRAHPSSTLPECERYLKCGDVHPGRTSCAPVASQVSWCVTPEGATARFDSGDVAVLRSLVAGRSRVSCETCSSEDGDASSGAWVPGDLAPEASPDTTIDVADVVRSLRLAVGLEAPDERAAITGDVAPARIEGGFAEVQGDGALTVSDVVMTLRAAVQLSVLRWPRHELVVSVPAATPPLAGFSVRIRGFRGEFGRPLWSSPACDEAAGDGLDLVADAAVVTCALPFGEIVGPATLGSLEWRGSRQQLGAIDSASLEVALADLGGATSAEAMLRLNGLSIPGN